MATRSLIGMKTPRGIDYIYCHWDGYPSNNGDLLYKYFDSANKVRKLIANGNISSLGIDMESTVFYKDRGDIWDDIKPRHTDILSTELCDNYNAEYVYLFEDEWLVAEVIDNGDPLNFETLKEVLKRLNNE